MTTQPNPVPEMHTGSPEIAPAAVPAARLMYWSLRRELWENRSLYIAPLGVAAVFLFGFLLSTLHLPKRMRALSALDAAHRHDAIVLSYDLAAVLILGSTLIVAVFYCLDALHSERRDRSILFWKSLPVSDLMTVLSKTSIAFALPLFGFVIVAVTQLIILLLSSGVLLMNGLSASEQWTQLSWFQMSMGLLFHLLTVHMLWHAPLYCWLLLVSGWARRAVILWALLPPLVICVVEKIAFNTMHCAHMLQYRLMGPEMGGFTAKGNMPMNQMTLSPGEFIASPGLWIGLVVAGAFFIAAVRLRRYRGPI